MGNLFLIKLKSSQNHQKIIVLKIIFTISLERDEYKGSGAGKAYGYIFKPDKDMEITSFFMQGDIDGVKQNIALNGLILIELETGNFEEFDDYRSINNYKEEYEKGDKYNWVSKTDFNPKEKNLCEWAKTYFIDSIYKWDENQEKCFKASKKHSKPLFIKRSKNEYTKENEIINLNESIKLSRGKEYAIYALENVNNTMYNYSDVYSDEHKNKNMIPVKMSETYVKDIYKSHIEKITMEI